MWRLRCGWWLGLVLVALAFPSMALAGTAGFEYKLENVVQKGKEEPELLLKATGDIESGTVHFERADGESFSVDFGAVGEGETTRIPIQQSSDTHRYDVTIEAKGANDESVETSFETKVTVAERLELSVDEDRAEIAKGSLEVRSNRPVERVELKVATSSGNVLQKGMKAVGGEHTFEVSWPADADIGEIRLKAYDEHGFWRGLLLQPFWVKIPHKEVRFEFGKATWEDDQEPKLETSIENIREAMQKHRSKGLQMQLYIAGYTDTVGSKESNRKLSRKRARAIGEWFQNHGLEVPVYYQGFGEDVLAVETPDETKNKKNRRAVYILGNATPPTSETIPRSNWTPLD